MEDAISFATDFSDSAMLLLFEIWLIGFFSVPFNFFLSFQSVFFIGVIVDFLCDCFFLKNLSILLLWYSFKLRLLWFWIYLGYFLLKLYRNLFKADYFFLTASRHVSLNQGLFYFGLGYIFGIVSRGFDSNDTILLYFLECSLLLLYKCFIESIKMQASSVI